MDRVIYPHAVRSTLRACAEYFATQSAQTLPNNPSAKRPPTTDELYHDLYNVLWLGETENPVLIPHLYKLVSLVYRYFLYLTENAIIETFSQSPDPLNPNPLPPITRQSLQKATIEVYSRYIAHLYENTSYLTIITPVIYAMMDLNHRITLLTRTIKYPIEIMIPLITLYDCMAKTALAHYSVIITSPELNVDNMLGVKVGNINKCLRYENVVHARRLAKYRERYATAHGESKTQNAENCASIDDTIVIDNTITNMIDTLIVPEDTEKIFETAQDTLNSTENVQNTTKSSCKKPSVTFLQPENIPRIDSDDLIDEDKYLNRDQPPKYPKYTPSHNHDVTLLPERESFYRCNWVLSPLQRVYWRGYREFLNSSLRFELDKQKYPTNLPPKLLQEYLYYEKHNLTVSLLDTWEELSIDIFTCLSSPGISSVLTKMNQDEPDTFDSVIETSVVFLSTPQLSIKIYYEIMRLHLSVMSVEMVTPRVLRLDYYGLFHSHLRQMFYRHDASAWLAHRGDLAAQQAFVKHFISDPYFTILLGLGVEIMLNCLQRHDYINHLWVERGPNHEHAALLLHLRREFLGLIAECAAGLFPLTQMMIYAMYMYRAPINTPSSPIHVADLLQYLSIYFQGLSVCTHYVSTTAFDRIQDITPRHGVVLHRLSEIYNAPQSAETFSLFIALIVMHQLKADMGGFNAAILAPFFHMQAGRLLFGQSIPSKPSFLEAAAILAIVDPKAPREVYNMNSSTMKKSFFKHISPALLFFEHLLTLRDTKRNGYSIIMISPSPTPRIEGENPFDSHREDLDEPRVEGGPGDDEVPPSPRRALYFDDLCQRHHFTPDSIVGQEAPAAHLLSRTNLLHFLNYMTLVYYANTMGIVSPQSNEDSDFFQHTEYPHLTHLEDILPLTRFHKCQHKMNRFILFMVNDFYAQTYVTYLNSTSTSFLTNTSANLMMDHLEILTLQKNRVHFTEKNGLSNITIDDPITQKLIIHEREINILWSKIAECVPDPHHIPFSLYLPNQIALPIHHALYYIQSRTFTMQFQQLSPVLLLLGESKGVLNEAFNNRLRTLLTHHLAYLILLRTYVCDPVQLYNDDLSNYIDLNELIHEAPDSKIPQIQALRDQFYNAGISYPYPVKSIKTQDTPLESKGFLPFPALLTMKSLLYSSLRYRKVHHPLIHKGLYLLFLEALLSSIHAFCLVDYSTRSSTDPFVLHHREQLFSFNLLSHPTTASFFESIYMNYNTPEFEQPLYWSTHYSHLQDIAQYSSTCSSTLRNEMYCEDVDRMVMPPASDYSSLMVQFSIEQVVNMLWNEQTNDVLQTIDFSAHSGTQKLDEKYTVITQQPTVQPTLQQISDYVTENPREWNNFNVNTTPLFFSSSSELSLEDFPSDPGIDKLNNTRWKLTKPHRNPLIVPHFIHGHFPFFTQNLTNKELDALYSTFIPDNILASSGAEITLHSQSNDESIMKYFRDTSSHYERISFNPLNDVPVSNFVNDLTFSPSTFVEDVVTHTFTEPTIFEYDDGFNMIVPTIKDRKKAKFYVHETPHITSVNEHESEDDQNSHESVNNVSEILYEEHSNEESRKEENEEHYNEFLFDQTSRYVDPQGWNKGSVAYKTIVGLKSYNPTQIQGLIDKTCHPSTQPHFFPHRSALLPFTPAFLTDFVPEGTTPWPSSYDLPKQDINPNTI